MTATMITTGTLNAGGEQHLERYAQMVIPLLSACGAQVRGRYKGIEALVGDSVLDLVAVIDFPNRETMKDFLASDAYQAALAHRNQAFQSISSFACETLN